MSRQPCLALSLALRAPSRDLGNGTTACLVQAGEEDAAWVVASCWLDAAIDWTLKQSQQGPKSALRPALGRPVMATGMEVDLADAGGWGFESSSPAGEEDELWDDDDRPEWALVNAVGQMHADGSHLGGPATGVAVDASESKMGSDRPSGAYRGSHPLDAYRSIATEEGKRMQLRNNDPGCDPVAALHLLAPQGGVSSLFSAGAVGMLVAIR